jgi:RNA polymerase sigma factor (sigma-70 family)
MTDPLISEYLPAIRGYIIKKYHWVDGKGNCLLTVDDLIQVASIILCRLVAGWDDFLAKEGKTRDGNNGLFWTFLEHQVKQEITRYSDRVAHDDRPREASFDDHAPGEESLAETRTSLRLLKDTPSWTVVNNELVDYFSTMRTRDKILIALRYFDELPYDQMADVLGLKSHTTVTNTMNAKNRWLRYARNLYVDDPVTIPPVGSAGAHRWDIPESLTTYLESRHRKDIHEYLGYVTICFRADVSYMASVLGSERVTAPGARPSSLSPYHQNQIDKMMLDGVSKIEISRVLGVGYELIKGHVKRRRSTLVA